MTKRQNIPMLRQPRNCDNNFVYSKFDRRKAGDELTNTTLYKYYDSTYKEAPFAVFITDDEFTVIWSNSAAEELFPVLRLPGGLFTVLACDNRYEIAASFAANEKKPVVLPVRALPGDVGIYCIPVYDEDRFVGACFHFYSRQLIGEKGLDKYLDSTNEKGIARISMISNELLSQNFSMITQLSEMPELKGNLRAKQLLDALYQNNIRNLRFARNFTLYNKYTSGIKDFAPVRVDLTRFMEQLAQRLTLYFDESRITFSASLPNAPLCVMADESKLTTAVLSLISNACKSIKGKGSVELRVESNKDNVRLSVSDTGSGIQPDDRAHLFQPWMRGQDNLKDAGLGLSLVQFIASEHGGTLMYESGEQGSIFVLSFPIDQSGPPVMSSYADYYVDRYSPVNIELCDVL